MMKLNYLDTNLHSQPAVLTVNCLSIQSEVNDPARVSDSWVILL